MRPGCLVTQAEPSPDVFTFSLHQRQFPPRSVAWAGLLEQLTVSVKRGGSHAPYHIQGEKNKPTVFPVAHRVPAHPAPSLQPPQLLCCSTSRPLHALLPLPTLLSPQILSRLAPSHLSGLSSDRPSPRALSTAYPWMCVSRPRTVPFSEGSYVLGYCLLPYRLSRNWKLKACSPS